MNTDRILYHGSPNTNITKLDIGKAKESGDQYGNGIYLTTNIKDAEVYAGPTGRIYKITLDPSIKLFGLDGKLPSDIVQYLQFEKDNMSEDMYNNICSRSRIQKSFTDKQEALKCFTEKKKEYAKKDNRYSRNMPKASVEKTTPIKYIVTYTDYDNIDNAISQLTGDDLYSIIIHDATPNTFVDLITSSGYDGIITHNNEWVIIYKNIDKVNILNESKVIPLGNLKRLDEVSRNQLIAKTKSQTITRYKKAAGYKGFSVIDIDTTSVFTRNCFRVTCRVGDYWDTIEMENILFWIQVEAEKNKDYQINAHGVRDAILNAADGVDIRVDCSCPDFAYRFSYGASQGGYKYGKLETRPANITNPNGYGALCKHLTAMLSNKKWLQQVAGTLMDFLVDRIDDVNKFLRVRPGEELTIPNELARQNAKKGFYSKLFKDKTDTEEEEIKDDNNESNNGNNNTDSNDNRNDDTNNDSTNMASNGNNNNNIKDTNTNLENNTSNDSDININDDTNIDKK